MRRLRYVLDRLSLQIMYFTFVRPILEYADVIWVNIPQEQKQQLDKIQNEAARIVNVYVQNLFLETTYKRNPVGKLLLIADTNTESHCFMNCFMA